MPRIPIILILFLFCLNSCKKEVTSIKETAPPPDTVFITPKDCNQIWYESATDEMGFYSNTYEHDSNNNIIKYNDVLISYNARKGIVRETYKNGQTIIYELDESGIAVKKIEGTVVTTYYRDNNFLTLEVIEYEGKRDTIFYINDIQNGNLIKQTIKRGGNIIGGSEMTHDLSHINTMPRGKSYLDFGYASETLNHKNLVATRVYTIGNNKITDRYTYYFDRAGRVTGLSKHRNGRTFNHQYKYRCDPF